MMAVDFIREAHVRVCNLAGKSYSLVLSIATAETAKSSLCGS